ncbi:MAG TPA: hypothetical protein ENG14_04290 [Thermodesulforhabdus norvegica]|uniref:Uncharacterized protein n=1 Tax=Thermodesulforhabdus norvegica TaxID=39841 RepID=A0A7C0WTU4_9BACT|nr:hypothetical protein [Thermodesulforhabdus norvegica]
MIEAEHEQLQKLYEEMSRDVKNISVELEKMARQRKREARSTLECIALLDDMISRVGRTKYGECQ